MAFSWRPYTFLQWKQFARLQGFLWCDAFWQHTAIAMRVQGFTAFNFTVTQFWTFANYPNVVFEQISMHAFVLQTEFMTDLQF